MCVVWRFLKGGGGGEASERNDFLFRGPPTEGGRQPTGGLRMARRAVTGSRAAAINRTAGSAKAGRSPARRPRGIPAWRPKPRAAPDRAARVRRGAPPKVGRPLLPKTISY